MRLYHGPECVETVRRSKRDGLGQIFQVGLPIDHFGEVLVRDEEVLMAIVKEELDGALELGAVLFGQRRVAHNKHATRALVVDFDFAFRQCTESNLLGRRGPRPFAPHFVEKAANARQAFGTLVRHVVALANDFKRENVTSCKGYLAYFVLKAQLRHDRVEAAVVPLANELAEVFGTRQDI